MKNIKTLPLVIALIIFAVLTACYEYYVYLWSLEQTGGAIIRVDIFMIYPVIIAVSVGVYFLAKKFFTN